MNEEKIKELVALWYSCLVDHHKDHDCHFYIEQKFSYGGESEWVVYHYGYLHSWSTDVKNYRDGCVVLYHALKHQIKLECEGWIKSKDKYVKKKYPNEYWQDILNKMEKI